MIRRMDRTRLSTRWHQVHPIEGTDPRMDGLWPFRRWLDKEDPNGERSMFDPWDPRWVDAYSPI